MHAVGDAGVSVTSAAGDAGDAGGAADQDIRHSASEPRAPHTLATGLAPSRHAGGSALQPCQPSMGDKL